MKSRLSAAFVCLSTCVAAAVVSGCKPGVAVVPVSGKVTVDNQPVTAGNVSYMPVGKESAAGMSTGQIKEDGSYTIYTAGKAGAPPGQYKVTVTGSMIPTGGGKMPSIPFSTKFTSVDSTPLTKEVKGDAPAGYYDLKLTK
jgi:hypothetical protein